MFYINFRDFDLKNSRKRLSLPNFLKSIAHRGEKHEEHNVVTRLERLDPDDYDSHYYNHHL